MKKLTPQEEADLKTVCEIAFEWCGEYGWGGDPRGEIKAVWDAAVRLRPDLEPKT